MSKRKQEESGEERVTAKSRPMMSLIARAPSTLSSSASESPGKRSYESQSTWSAQAEKYDRTSHAPGHCQRFVESSYSARHSGWDDDKAWSSQEWKADELMDDTTGTPVVASWARTHEFQSSLSHEKTKHVILEEEETHDRTGTPVVCPQRRARSQQFIIGDDETELELSSRSRSFLDMVNDPVRKRHKRSSQVTSFAAAARSLSRDFLQVLPCAGPTFLCNLRQLSKPRSPPADVRTSTCSECKTIVVTH